MENYQKNKQKAVPKDTVTGQAVKPETEYERFRRRIAEVILDTDAIMGDIRTWLGTFSEYDYDDWKSIKETGELPEGISELSWGDLR